MATTANKSTEIYKEMIRVLEDRIIEVTSSENQQSRIEIKKEIQSMQGKLNALEDKIDEQKDLDLILKQDEQDRQEDEQENLEEAHAKTKEDVKKILKDASPIPLATPKEILEVKKAMGQKQNFNAEKGPEFENSDIHIKDQLAEVKEISKGDISEELSRKGEDALNQIKTMGESISNNVAQCANDPTAFDRANLYSKTISPVPSPDSNKAQVEEDVSQSASFNNTIRA